MMVAAYRILLRLYSREYQIQFTDEMVDVFTERAIELRGQGRLAYTRFLVHECIGILTGALTDQSRRVSITPAVGGIGLAALLHVALYAGAVALLPEITGAVGNPSASAKDPERAVLLDGVCAFTTVLCLLPLLLLLSMRLIRREH
jgi:hypothetical protein